MNTKKIIWLSIAAIIGLPLIIGFFVCISYANRDISLHNKFKAKFSERTAFYDKMWKTLKGKGQIAVKNDSSFKNNIETIMAGRKDAGGLMMKWVQEANPNSNYAAVSALYEDLSRAIEAERTGFFNREKELQDIVREDDDMLDHFPGNLLLGSILGRQHIQYKPITSDITDEVIKTGKDNNANAF